MASTFEGNGVSFTFAGLTLKAQTIEIPGWTKAILDISTLSNVAARTKFVGALKDFGSLVLNCEFDASVYDSLPETEQTLIITVPSVGTITYWAKMSELGSVTMANDEQPLYPITLAITNLTGTTETVPVFST